MCPLCALTGLTTWVLAGGVGGSCAATAAVYWRRRKASPDENSARGAGGSIDCVSIDGPTTQPTQRPT